MVCAGDKIELAVSYNFPELISPREEIPFESCFRVGDTILMNQK